jgi:phosphoribosylglycinamide formyltransferase-1
MQLDIAILASHNGSNAKAILSNIKAGKLIANPKVIISNNPDANVLNTANEFDIPNYCINRRKSPNLDETIIQTLKDHDVNLIVLAGYMKKISPAIIQAYQNRILNIHPSLLPKYGGKGMYGINIHTAVIKSQDTISGATIHLVNVEYDKGKTLSQATIPRFEQDTTQTLARRILALEHILYTQTLIDIQEDLIILD